MPSVYIPALLRTATGGRELVSVSGTTVREVVASLESQYPDLKGRLVQDGKLLSNLAVGIDGEVSVLGLADEVGADSEVQFLTAIKGGSDAFLDESLAVLSRTPAAFDALLRGLPDAWIMATEGEGTWSPYDVLGHLIHCERADWMPRVSMILEHGPSRPFAPLDRELRGGAGRPLPDLLDEFIALRSESLAQLRSLDLQLTLTGTHPAFGEVTLRQLLATWTAHDLAHLVQVSRTMARRYSGEVGPWAAYLSVFNPQR